MSATTANTPADRPTRVWRLILAMCCCISFLLYLHRYTWGFIKEDIRLEFGWDPRQLGFLDTLFTVSYGAGQIPSGILCDWYGAHLLLGGAILTWSLALALIAVANGVASMAIARLTLGAAQAGAYPMLNKISKNWFPIEQRSTAQGLIATFAGRAGGAASFIIFGAVLVGGLELSWRTAVLVFSAVGIVCGILFLLLFRNTPREHPWASEAEEQRIARGDPAAVVATGAKLNWSALRRSRTFWFLLLRAVFSNMADVLFVYWVPQYLRQLWGLSEARTGWLAALPLIGGAMGGLTSGVLQSRIIRRTGNLRLARTGVGGCGKLAAGVFMALSLLLADPTLIAFTFLAAKFFTDMEQPAEWGTASDIGGGSAATVFACINTVGAVGGTIGGLLIGELLQRNSAVGAPTAAGWNLVFAVTAVEYFLAAGCWLFIDSRKPLETAPPVRP